jgi:hypothetical protein
MCFDGAILCYEFSKASMYFQRNGQLYTVINFSSYLLLFSYIDSMKNTCVNFLRVHYVMIWRYCLMMKMMHLLGIYIVYGFRFHFFSTLYYGHRISNANMSIAQQMFDTCVKRITTLFSFKSPTERDSAAVRKWLELSLKIFVAEVSCLYLLLLLYICIVCTS